MRAFTHVCVRAIAIVGCAAACQPITFSSQNNVLQLDAAGFVDPNASRVPVMLEGATMCPPVDMFATNFQLVDVTPCFDQAVAGAAVTTDDACITFAGEGDVTWSFTPTSSPPPTCAAPAAIRADAFAFRAIAAEHVHAHVVQPLDEIMLGPARQQLGIAALQALPNDWAAIDHVAIFAGRPVAPSIALIGDDGARVTWRRADAKIDVAGAGVYGFDQQPTIVAQQGSAATIGVTLYGKRTETAAIAADGVDDVASMDVLRFGIDDRTTGARTTTVLRAYLHDRLARVVLGAPVQWRVVDGDVAIQSFASSEGLGNVKDGEWIGVSDCRPPPAPALIAGTGVNEERDATIEARLDRFVTTIPLRWSVPPAQSDDARKAWKAPDGCPSPADAAGGCASTSPSPIAPVAVVAALLLANTRVRRLRSARTSVD